MAAAKALYASLRKHLGPAGAEKNVVPQKVYLYPIRYMKLDPMVALLKVIVSFGCFSLTVSLLCAFETSFMGTVLSVFSAHWN